MRTPLAALSLACILAGAAPLPAQEPPEPIPEFRTNEALVLVGATAGSMAGMTMWVLSEGIESTDPSWGAAAIFTTLGCAFGGWVGAGADNTPSFGRFMLGAAAGIAGGLVLGTVTGGSDPRLGDVVFAYSLGQGIVATWLGTRSPRRPR